MLGSIVAQKIFLDFMSRFWSARIDTGTQVENDIGLSLEGLLHVTS